ncbi:MAG: peroxiredoxin [Bacteroidetes bacterium]|nr:peroxiredoxin [Bacteroidota bacterium]
MVRTLLTIAIVVSFAASNVFALGPEMIGKPAPAFTLKTIDGHSILSLDALRGQVVIIDFWASWCAPCRRSLPQLVALEAGKAGVKLVAVNIDDDRKNGVEFLKRNRISLVSLYDEAKHVVDQYDVPAMPSALIIDKRGVVRFVHAGYTESDIEIIKKEVERLL